jgi:hypothetical protein
MTLGSIVHASPDQVSCDLQGEAAILNLRTGIYYGLDAVGAAIWKLIEQPRTVASIREAVVAEFDVQPETAERDLFDLLGGLSAEGLIETRDPQAA